MPKLLASLSLFLPLCVAFAWCPLRSAAQCPATATSTLSEVVPDSSPSLQKYLWTMGENDRDSLENLGRASENVGEKLSNVRENLKNFRLSLENVGSSSQNVGRFSVNLGQRIANLGSCSENEREVATNLPRFSASPLKVQPSMWRVDAVALGGTWGSVLVTDQYQRAWMVGRSLSGAVVSLRHRTQWDAPEVFAHDYNFPSWALAVQWVDLSRASMRKGTSPWWGEARPVDYLSNSGHLFSLVGSFSRPFQRSQHGEWGYSLEEGLAFCTRPYNRKDNVDNELTGSPWLFHFGASVYCELQLSARWRLRADLAFRHVSNGATHRPNKGANMFQPTLALQYEFSPSTKSIPLEEIAPSPNVRALPSEGRSATSQGRVATSQLLVHPSMNPRFFAKIRPHWFVHIEGNLGLRTLLEEWLRTQYGTSPQDPSYRTDHFRRYFVYNFQADFMRRYARRWALGGGLDVFALPYVHRLRDYAPQDGSVRHFSPFSLGVAVKHESYYGRLSSYVHLGCYLLRQTGHLPTTDETSYYERVGLRYRLMRKNAQERHRGLTLSIGIKAHKLKADFAEIGIGWDF